MKMKTLSLIFIALPGYFAVSSTSQAVAPPPDGGYAGGNTAEGDNALLSLTTGTYNTAIGWFSKALVGNFNTGVGAGTLLTNIGDDNTATGAGALLNNTTGANNAATGVFALFDNTIGGSNTATGFGALGNNTAGNSNTATGASALLSNTIGNFNTAYGANTLLNNTAAANNTAIGYQAPLSNTSGLGNTAVGFNTLQSSTIGNANTALGVMRCQGTRPAGGIRYSLLARWLAILLAIRTRLSQRRTHFQYHRQRKCCVRRRRRRDRQFFPTLQDRCSNNGQSQPSHFRPEACDLSLRK